MVTSTHVLLLLIVQICVLVQSEPVKMAMMGWMSITNSSGSERIWMDFLRPSHYVWALAIEHFNNRDSSIIPALGQLGNCSKTIEVVTGKILNDFGTSGQGMKLLVEHVADPIRFILGPVKSVVAVPLSVTSGAMQIPVVSHFATSAALSNKASYPTFARVVPADTTVASAMANAFQLWKFRKVALIYVQDDFGTAWKDSLFAELDSRNIGLVSTPFQDTLDGIDNSVDNAVRVIKAENLNVIVFIFVDDTALASLEKATIKYNMTSQEGKFWVFNFQGGGNRAERFSFLRNGGVSFATAIPSDNVEYNALKNYVKDNNITSQLSSYFPSYTINGDTYQLSETALKGRAIATAEAYTYDMVIATGISLCLKSNDSSYDPNGLQMYQDLLKVDFKGASGRVRFDSKGDRQASTLFFSMSNFQLVGDQIQFVQVGTQNSSAIWTISDTIRFPTGSNLAPMDVTPPYHERNLLPTWAKAIGYAETIIILFLSLASLVFLQLNMDSKVIVNGQPSFLKLLILGVVIAAISIIILTLDDASGVAPFGSCMAFPWLLGCGMNIAIGSLMAKSYRISLIFNNPKFKKLRATTGKFFFLVSFMTILEIIILISWTLVAPLQFERIIVYADGFGNPFESYGICVGPSPSSGAFVGVILAIHAIQIFFVTKIALSLRNVPVKYQETRWIAYAAISMLQVYFVGLPTTAAVYNEPIGRFLVLSSVVFLTCFSILTALFYPKWMMQRYGDNYFDESHLSSKLVVNNNTENMTPSAHVKPSSNIQQSPRQIGFTDDIISKSES